VSYLIRSIYLPCFLNSFPSPGIYEQYKLRQSHNTRPTVGSPTGLPAGRGTPRAAVRHRAAGQPGFTCAQGDSRSVAIGDLIVEPNRGHRRGVSCVQRARVGALSPRPVGHGGAHTLVVPFMQYRTDDQAARLVRSLLVDHLARQMRGVCAQSTILLLNSNDTQVFCIFEREKQSHNTQTQ
jgi:hypothetical protein